MITRLALGTVLISLVLSGCKKDKESELVLASNLTMEVVEDTATLGKVDVSASASNANYYTITFTEGAKTFSDENSTGKATYTFGESGTHRVQVKAHTTVDQYIQLSQAIEINLDTGSGPGDTGSFEFPSNGYTTPTSYTGYNLVWQDEFDGTSLSGDWNYEIGTGNSGWGNNELQYYLQENVTVANGVLTIEAKKETYNSSDYTSSRITTQNKQSFQYGRIDIRAAMPKGQGIWPALWMLGDNFATDGWPECGEIDIMEMVGGTPATDRGDDVTHGTIHWSDNGQHANYTGNRKLSSGTLADEWHVYSITWDNQEIKWYLDDNLFHTADITPGGLSEFHQKFFLIFNVAVGGNWPGSPDASTTFPQKMFVDYV